jgi:hypothetical protein
MQEIGESALNGELAIDSRRFGAAQSAAAVAFSCFFTISSWP